MPELRTSSGATLALLTGLAYWALVSAMSGGVEPWDAPAFWTIAFPGALALSALLGALAPMRAWAWGAIVMLAQVPVVIALAGAGPLLIVGLLYAAVLAVPAAFVSWAGGASRRCSSRPDRSTR